jgi:hypothetical protein
LNEGLQVHITIRLAHHGAEGVHNDDGRVSLFNFFGDLLQDRAEVFLQDNLAQVLTSMLAVIGNITITNAFVILPSLCVTLMVCIYGLVKIPELTMSILSGRAGTWVSPMGGE